MTSVHPTSRLATTALLTALAVGAASTSTAAVVAGASTPTVAGASTPTVAPAVEAELTALSPVSLAGHDYPDPDWRRLPVLDRQLLIQLSRLHEVFAAPGNAARIWDRSYRPDRTPMMFAPVSEPDTAPRYAYLVGHPDPAAAGSVRRLRLPPALGLPDVFRLTRGAGMTEIAEVSATEGASVAGTRTILFRYREYPGDPLALEPVTPDVTVAAAVIAHETFHFSYQDQRWRIDAEPDISPDEVADAPWNALALVEHRLLMRRTDTPAQARETLRAVAAIRQTRATAHPAAARGESAREWQEGTARSVDQRVARLQGFTPAWDESIPRLPDDLYAFLLVGRTYPGGARVVDLLDQAHGPSWRRDIADNSLTKILLSRTGPIGEQERRTSVAASKRTFDYEDLLATVTAADLPSVYERFASPPAGADEAPPADPPGN